MIIEATTIGASGAKMAAIKPDKTDGLFVGAMYFAASPWVIYPLAAGFSVFNGLVFANLSGLISRSADQKIQGEILGINASVQALAQLIPPVLSG